MHLGMTGRFEIEDGDDSHSPGRFRFPAPVSGKHAHVVLQTEAGRRVVYSDLPAVRVHGPDPHGTA